MGYVRKKVQGEIPFSCYTLLEGQAEFFDPKLVSPSKVILYDPFHRVHVAM